MQLSGNLNHHILYKYIKTFIYENNTRTLFFTSFGYDRMQ